jgi:polysaccharide deacetylase family protein (PEP-CTERM system associated)
MSATECIFSIDAEDWFNISAVKAEPDFAAWDTLPSRVEHNFNKLLDVVALHEVKVTCFFISYFAKRFPALARRAVAEGHEIASHGTKHKLVFEQSADEFYDDVLTARKTIEDISGSPVRGYRAASFSVTEKTPWFFEKLAAAGYTYDSSVFPGMRVVGGLKTSSLAPYNVTTSDGPVIEYPISALKIMGHNWCFFGGGYLRLTPYWLVHALGERVMDEGRPVVFYVHPREIDPEQPHLPMPFKRRLMTYVNISTTENKIHHILTDFRVTTYREHIAAHQQ